MRPSTAPLVLWLVACQADDPHRRPSPAELLLEDQGVVGYLVDDVAGAPPVSAWVRAVNRWGAAVPADAAPLQVDGVAWEVALDATGYGELLLEAPGVVEITGGAEPAVAVVEDTHWAGFDLHPAQFAPLPGASDAVALTVGAAAAVDDEVWWVGPQGRAHRVLQADGPIRGLRARRVDVDAILDVIAWTDQRVFVLRGRAAGGLAWGAGLVAPGYTVASADAADLDGDGLGDLAIAWVADDGASLLDVHHGDGLYGFTPTVPRNLPGIPSSLAIGDNIGRGGLQITVIDRDGDWSRYFAARHPERPDEPARYVPMGPARPDALIIPEGSTLDADGDLDASGADQLWIYGPREEGRPRTIYLVELVGRRIEYIPLSPPSAFVSRADLDADGLPDLVMVHDDGSLHSLAYAQDTGSYVTRGLGWLVDHAPFAIGSFLGAPDPDLFVAGEAIWRWWAGAHDPEDPLTYWELLPAGAEEVGRSDGAVAVIGSGLSAVDVATVELEGSVVRLVTHRFDGDDLDRRGQVQLSGAGELPLDLAVCDGFAWVLMPAEVIRVSLTPVGSPQVTGRADVVGTRVACGEGPGGAHGAVLGAGEVTLYGPGLGVLDTLAAPGAHDVALGDVGEGPEVATCEAPGCAVVWWPWGDEGEASFARSSGGRITVDDGLPRSFLAWGDLAVADVDGDGRPDLVASEPAGGIAVMRSAGVAVSPPRAFHLPFRILAPVAVGGEGAGVGTLWAVDADGALHLAGPRSDEARR